MLSVSPVNLDLADRLRGDPEFRAEFFRLAAQETIASQIRFLRELRQLRQADLAKMTGMKQSAISRIEKADYASWNYATLVRLAEALNARLRVTFEPSEDVIRSLEGGTGDGLIQKLNGRRNEQSGNTGPKRRGRHAKSTGYTAVRILIALAMLVFVVPEADAQSRPGWRQYCNNYGHCEWRRIRRTYEPTRVYGYERREDEDRPLRSDQCLQVEIDVLSTEHQSEENAREAARKLWMAKTQWQHGGQYMSLDDAAHIRWRCGPSSAHDTVAGKLSEVAGALTGKGGQNVRCALWARPCRVERSPGDERSRR